MLKLLKYEWKACARVCLPLYGTAILLALFGRIFIALNPVLNHSELYVIAGFLGSFLYFGVMVAVFVVTLVILVQRFYKNLLGSEGYLMFTLPVTTSQHIWSKAIVSLAISIISFIAAGLSVMIMSLGANMPKELFKLISTIVNGLNFNGFLVLLETFLLIIAASLCGILFIYLCIALGHLAKKYREALAVVWYFALSTALQFLMVIFLNIAAHTPLRGIIGWVQSLPHYVQTHLVLLFFFAVSAIALAAFFFGTNYILKNKLNLE